MSVTVTSSLRVALVSGTGVTFDAPVVQLISTDDVYNPDNPAETLTDLLDAVSSAKLVGSASIDGTVVGNTSIFTVSTGEKFIPTSIMFALTGVSGSGEGPSINAGFTATAYTDYIDSLRSTTYTLTGGSIFAAGSGYTIGDVLAFAGGTTTDDAAIEVISAGVVSLALNAAGTVYAPGDTVTLAGGVPLTRGVITVSTVKLVSAAIVAGGTGYGNTQTFDVTIVGGTNTVTATVNVTSDALGVVDTVNSVSVAGNYTVLPDLTANAVTGGSGTGLTLDLVFGINTFTITTNGEYTTTVASFTQFSTSGTGTGATFNTALFGVVDYSINDAGSYEVVPTNHIATTGGTGTGATFDAVWSVEAGPFLNIGTLGQLVEFTDFTATAGNNGEDFVYMTGGEVMKVRVAFPATFTTYTIKAFVFGFTFT